MEVKDEARPGLLAALGFVLLVSLVAVGPDEVLIAAGVPRRAALPLQASVVFAGRIVREKPSLGDPSVKLVSYAFLGQEALADLGMLVVAACGALYLRRRAHPPFALDRSAVRETARITAFLAGGLAIAGLAAGLVAARLDGGAPLRAFLDHLDMPLLARPEGVLLALTGMLFLAPLAEEIVFRGVLYGALRTRLDPPRAAVVQAGIFAACHLGTGRQPVLIVIPYVWGVAAAVTLERTRSLGAAILLHAAGNAAGLVIVAVVMGMPAEIYALLGGR